MLDTSGPAAVSWGLAGSIVISVVALLASAVFGWSSAAATTCEELAGLKLPDTTTTLAQSVAAGAFTPPAGRRPALRTSPAPSRARRFLPS